MNCKKCGDPLNYPPRIYETIGPVCYKCHDILTAPNPPKTKVFYMSGPRVTVSDRRSYLIRKPGEPSYLIRIMPADPGANPVITCDCDEGKAGLRCDHIGTVEAIDRRKFEITEGKK